ncbi:hypothetical protein [Streptomyces sp. V17-9]|uniref:hypothetical protein n=1 Tax=Streptomyces sp. V17-9 TaxID=2831149 RepID=UPI001BAEF396|nr:hypothetical protein [Streptomyces sp. V17-9]QUW93307.1 hypothetical protein KE639_04555 [Streptomyces sp. V17-9]
MADEQDKWLDRETAELLLRGEPLEELESTDPATRERAARLVAALGELSAPPAPTGEELPGEAAALAAFRKVRAERADAAADAPGTLGHGAAPGPLDAGLVRIGPRGDGARRARWSRPLRLGLAAALTVGMVGGVAVAAGTGVLPTPFGGTEPEPAATVSAAASPDRPLAPPSPLDGVQGGSRPGAAPDTPGGGTARDGGGSEDRDADGRDPDGSDGQRSDLAASCRKVRDGRQLDAAHRHALKEAAGGASRVAKYCGNLLGGSGGGTGGRDGAGHGDSGEAAHEGELRQDTGDDRSGNGGRNGKDGKGDRGGKGSQGDKGDKGKGGKKGDDGRGDHGNRDDDGDDGGKGGNGGNGDDDDADIAPPAHGPHRPHTPHAPSAHEPRPQQPPAYAPHAAHSATLA